MISEILAQTPPPTFDWVTPVSATSVIAFFGVLTKWLMSTITTELKSHTTALNEQTRLFLVTVGEHTRSLENAMYHNTRATLLMGIAVEQANADLKAKLKLCFEELEEKEKRASGRKMS